jgi:hypothetical protein
MVASIQSVGLKKGVRWARLVRMGRVKLVLSVRGIFFVCKVQPQGHGLRRNQNIIS